MNSIKKTIKINKSSSHKLLLGLLCVFTFFQNEVRSQSIVDSLKNEIQLAAGNDSLQIELYLKLGFEYKYQGGGEETLALIDTIFVLDCDCVCKCKFDINIDEIFVFSSYNILVPTKLKLSRLKS